MRRYGFEHVESYDPLSSPKRPTGDFDLVTCFEVIEHSPQPLATMTEMRDMLEIGGAIIIGQSLQPRNIDEIGARWWYIAPRNGHVSIFADETFLVLSNLAALTYYRGTGFYAFAKGEVSKPLQSAIARIGTPCHLRTLSAPPVDILDPAWHGIEGAAAGTFRWTAAEKLHWSNVEFLPGTTVVRIQFLMEVRGGFASECVIEVGGNAVPTWVEGRKIIGEVTHDGAVTRDVLLNTPSALIPGDSGRTGDTRVLGLAIVC